MNRGKRARGLRRLEHLADFIEKLAPERLTFDHWWFEWNVPLEPATHCANPLFWATSVPTLRRAGLELVVVEVGDLDVPLFRLKGFFPTSRYIERLARDETRVSADWILETAERFFSIDSDEADHLFGGTPSVIWCEQHGSPAGFARYLRAFIAADGIPRDPHRFARRGIYPVPPAFSHAYGADPARLPVPGDTPLVGLKPVLPGSGIQYMLCDGSVWRYVGLGGLSFDPRSGVNGWLFAECQCHEIGRYDCAGCRLLHAPRSTGS